MLKTMDFSGMTDSQLVNLYKTKGSGEYIGELYKRYTKMVFVLCSKYLKNNDAAKEAVSHIFENVISYMKKYDIDNFRSWLISVTRNHCFFMLKNDKGIVQYCDMFEKNPERFVEFEEFFHLSDVENREELYTKLEDAINKLPPTQKTCIELFYLNGKSYSDIEQISGFTYNQIKSFIQNGRRNLKIILS